MTRLLGALALLLLAAPAAADAEPEEALLRAPAGPYRGTVVDAATNRPLPDALVVVLWLRPDPRPYGQTLVVTAHETLTNEAGEFAVDEAALEARLAGAALAPGIMIFKPGYTPYPPTPSRAPVGAPARQFSGPGQKLGLAPTIDYEDRVEAFNTFAAMLEREGLLLSPTLPLASDLLLHELQNLGCTPLRPPAGPR